MAISSKRIESLLDKARVAVENALAHPDIKEKIIKFGYDDDRLQEGKTLYTQASASYQEQQRRRGEQIASSDKLTDKIRQERDRYIEYRELARRVFDSADKDGVRKTLGLDGRARQTLSGLLKEARQLYEGALGDNEIMAKLSTFDISAEKFQAALEGVKELENLDREQESKKGAAQKATMERDSLYRRLHKWLGDFRAACRIALKDDPQQLEKMKIKAYSEDYKKRGKKKEDKEEQEEAQETVNSEAGEIS